ncbi:MAG: hypothetical protein ACM3SS_05380 [Rhodospirillaceae bacterium]
MNAPMKIAIGAAVAVLAAGCVSMPTGPSMMVLPGTGRTFDEFRADDMTCRQYAYDNIGGNTAQRAAEDAGVKSAAVGTLLGAAVGAAANGGQGAAVGAGVGMGMGGLVGTGAAETSAYGAQRRYDNAYIQCMYAKGHRVPVSGRFTTYTPSPAPRAATPPPPSAAVTPPPPPAGTPPPPPPPGSAPAPRPGG